MPFDWREYLIVAHELRNDPREGVQRTCLGRTYYYIYNLGLTKARALSFSGKPPSLHTQLWQWCQQQLDPDIKLLGVLGYRMLSLRQSADYDSAPIQDIARELKTQISRAQKFEALVAKSNQQQPHPTLAP